MELIGNFFLWKFLYNPFGIGSFGVVSHAKRWMDCMGLALVRLTDLCFTILILAGIIIINQNCLSTIRYVILCASLWIYKSVTNLQYHDTYTFQGLSALQDIPRPNHCIYRTKSFSSQIECIWTPHFFLRWLQVCNYLSIEAPFLTSHQFVQMFATLLKKLGSFLFNIQGVIKRTGLFLIKHFDKVFFNLPRILKLF